MLETFNSYLEQAVGILWGIPMVVVLVGGGLFWTVYLGFPQVRYFKHALQVVLGRYDNPEDPGEISHFKALCAALSGTVGLGNIAGVAVAIKLGGPGATLWMILAGVLGMATKFSECTLAVMYRKVDAKGEVHGGAMHYIEQGLGEKFKPLSYMFAFCCIFACIGAANLFQINQVAVIAQSSFGIPHLASGIVMMVLTGIVILGGIKRIGHVAAMLVPVMGLGYVAACLLILVLNAQAIPQAMGEIFFGAVSGTAAAGGFAGAGVQAVLIQGIRRAVFSNEAGLGTAAIAHSAAKTKEPVREGVVALLEPFIDTVIICTMTALVVSISGAWRGEFTGVELTATALNHTLPGFGTYFIPIAVFCFAYSTIISWSYYGERSVDYLFGERFVLGFRLVYCLFVVVGALWALVPILNFSDSALALMVIPNMLCLFLMAPRIRRASSAYYLRLKAGEFEPPFSSPDSLRTELDAGEERRKVIGG